VAALEGSGLFETPCNFTRNFLQEQGSTLKSCTTYDYACLKDVDVVYHTADQQQGNISAISPEEGERLLDFVKCGGSLVAYHGHKAAEQVPDFAWQFAQTFGVEMIETGVCLSQSDIPMFAPKTAALPEALRLNPSCGGTVDQIGWNNNCHEQLKIDATHPVGQHAKAVYIHEEGHSNCNSYCDGQAASKEVHLEQVIIDAGALDL
jgi:hypothetical protein